MGLLHVPWASMTPLAKAAATTKTAAKTKTRMAAVRTKTTRGETDAKRVVEMPCRTSTTQWNSTMKGGPVSAKEEGQLKGEARARSASENGRRIKPM